MGAKFLSDADEQRLKVFGWLLPCIAFGFAIVLFVSFWAQASEAKEREELVSQLNRLPASYSVTFDSNEIANRSDVVSALKSVAETKAHHSGPIEPHLIRIKSDRDVIEVCLERDSERPNEFWVSKPRKGTCGQTSFGQPYFGRLTTDRLAPYWTPSRARGFTPVSLKPSGARAGWTLCRVHHCGRHCERLPATTACERGTDSKAAA